MVRILPLLLGLALFAGCKSQNPPPPGEKPAIGEEQSLWDKAVEKGCEVNPFVSHRDPVPSPYPPMAIEDLPAPMAFEVVPRESFAYSHLSMRVAKLCYRGLAPIADIHRFYDDTMPSFGWKQKFVLGHDRPDLVYEKGEEQCEVVITDQDKYREVTLSLSPK